MDNIHFIEADEARVGASLINDVYRLRSEIFSRRLGWEVNSENGLEKDEFDALEVSHIALTDNQKKVVGCWRALPTKGPYMLGTVFPQLLRGERLPQDADVWEISRFGVSKDHDTKNPGMVSENTARLVKSFYDFASLKAIKSYVLVTTVACERILRLLGVKTRRMGDGKSMQVGIEKSIALWVDVDESLNLKV